MSVRSCGSTFIGSLIQQLHTPRPSESDVSLNVFSDLLVLISEAKGLNYSGFSKSKGIFYCEVEIDGIVAARSSCKMCSNSDALFWGERFQFRNLRFVRTAVVKLYRDPMNWRRSPQQLMGYISVPLMESGHGEFTEMWHTLQTTSRGTSPVQIRLRTSFQKLVILDAEFYDPLRSYVLENVDKLCKILEPLLPSKAKDELAQTLVYILKDNGQVIKFMTNILVQEVETLERENLILRANSFASKSIDCYMKLTGTSYLKTVLSSIVHYIILSAPECEVDPTRVADSQSISEHQEVLLVVVERVWTAIYRGLDAFPADLQYIFSDVRRRVADRGETIWKRIVAATVFLRFFCPAILSPSLFHVTHKYPDDKACRRLTLVAKVIQNLANATRFGGKEEYMVFFNDFVDREMPTMDMFLNRVSSTVEYSKELESHGVASLADLMAFDLQMADTMAETDGQDAKEGLPVRESKARIENASPAGDQKPVASLECIRPPDRDLAVLHRILAHHLPLMDPVATKDLDDLSVIVAGLQAEVAMEKARAALPPVQFMSSEYEIKSGSVDQRSARRSSSLKYPLYDVQREEEPHLCNSDGRLEKNISELDDGSYAIHL